MLILLLKSRVDPYVRGGVIVSGYERQGDLFANTDHAPAAPKAAVERQSPPEPKVPKPAPAADPAHDTRHYVTMIREPGTKAQKVAWLAGPFGSKDEADGHVAAAREHANKVDPWSAFDAFGVTARTAATHPPGKLNAHMGIGGDNPPEPTGPPAEAAPKPDGKPKKKPPGPAKVARIQVVRGRRAGWPSIKVREITEGGRVLNSYEHTRYSEAVANARRLARHHGAELALEE